MKKSITTFIAVLTILSFFVGTHAAAAAQILPGRYVALGDSVAAGAGLPLKDNLPESRACGRAAQAYPYAVGTALNLPVEQFACGGATVPAGITGPQIAN